MTGVVNPRQSALEVPLCRHHFSRKLLALLALAGDRLRPLTTSLTRQRRIVRDEAALGELRIPHKSNAKWRLEACTLGPSLALQASREAQVLSAQS